MSKVTPGLLLCVDVGSAMTRAWLIDVGSAEVHARGALPTGHPPRGDPLDGVAAVRAQVCAAAGLGEDVVPVTALRLSSSAGGALRVAVVAPDEAAARRAGWLTHGCGGLVVHRHGGELDWAGLTAVAKAAPDVVLLVGGDDEQLVRNARRLAGHKRSAVPVVLAAEGPGARDAIGQLTAQGRTVEAVGPLTATDASEADGAVPPRIRKVIGELYAKHAIDGRTPSVRSRARLDGVPFKRLSCCATPDAMLAGVQALQAVVGDGVLVVDVGASTSAVYSVLPTGAGDTAGVDWNDAPSWRTIEGDLGLRGSAPLLVQAAEQEGLVEGPFDAVTASLAELAEHAAAMATDPGRVCEEGAERRVDVELAVLAARVAVRRHARPPRPGRAGRPLAGVGLLLGAGGLLAHADDKVRRAVLEPLTTDHGGGWDVPTEARLGVDEEGLLIAAGLLSPDHPDVARELVGRVAAHRVAG